MTTTAEDIESLIRGKLSVNRDLFERRMDTLARLISGRNTCASSKFSK